MQQVISVFGVTGAGKSSLMDHIRKDNYHNFGLIEVGKELRKRHPPEYFQGRGAMPQTEAEVWEIIDEYINRNTHDVYLIDGQPRLPIQVRIMYKRFGWFPIVWLHASDAELERRVSLRPPQERELANARLTNDRVQLFDVLHAYHSIVPMPKIVSINTEIPGWFNIIQGRIYARDGWSKKDI